MKAKWSDVPDDIKNTFERLGIPQAERKSLAGVGAQYDSELVYHTSARKLRRRVLSIPIWRVRCMVSTRIWCGNTYETGETDRPQICRTARSRLVRRFVCLCAEGGFVEIPLQSYFRLNAPGAGQFEHTLIIVDEDADLHFIEGCSAPKYNVANLHAGCVELFVGKNARLRYSTIENWSKNMYNLNTKRAQVEEGGKIEWVSGSFGSHVSYLYPMSVLKGRGAKMEFTASRSPVRARISIPERRLSTARRIRVPILTRNRSRRTAASAPSVRQSLQQKRQRTRNQPFPASL